MLYPLTGSIGIGKVITTFINITELGSQDIALTNATAEEKSFKDVIKFTTKITGSANPVLKLDPIPDRFRVIEANAIKSADRTDVHQVTVTLLFPNLADVRDAMRAGTMSDLSGDTETRAFENNCVATEREREERFGTLRRTPPEVYCRYNNER
jgi:hypothetical protein